VFAETFTAGTLLTFDFGLTTNIDAGGTPDQFSLALLQSDGTLIPSSDASGALLVANIDSAQPGFLGFATELTPAPIVTFAATAPEPSSPLLLAMGLAVALWSARERRTTAATAARFTSQCLVLPAILRIVRWTPRPGRRSRVFRPPRRSRVDSRIQRGEEAMKESIRRYQLVRAASILAAAGSMLWSATTLAGPTTWYVSAWNTPGGTSCLNLIDGRTPQTAFPSIEAAIACAGNGDTIKIEAASNTQFIYFPAGTLVIASKLTIIGTGPGFVLASTDYPAIDGQGKFRVLENQSANTSITNVEIDNGLAADKGGGIWNHPKGAGLTLNGVLVYGNSAPLGGGVYNEGTLTATNSTISTNTATGANIGACTIGGGVTARGGGIYNDGTSGGPGGNLNLSQVSIIANTATSSGQTSGCADGGGIFNDGGLVALTNHSSVTSNNATGKFAGAGGGGIANFSGDVSVTASTVSDNTLQCPIFIQAAVCGVGAGIENLDMLDLTDATVLGNHPTSVSGPIWGGGIYTSNGSTVDIHKGSTSIVGNSVGGSVGQGGGIYAYGLLPPNGVVQFDSNSTTSLASNLGGQCGGTGDFDPKGGGVRLYCNGAPISFSKGPCPCP
jgi:hypothetical protein